MAASPAPSPDGSYGTYPSSGHSTPQPGTNCVFVPIDLPAKNNNSNSSNSNNSSSNNNNNRRAMCDPESGQHQGHVQGQTQMTAAQSEAHYLHVATSDGGGDGGSHFTMADVNVSSPQITWSTGSDGMSFTFSGVPTGGTMTSTSECSYASSVDDLDDQRSTGDETSKPKPKRRRVITKDQRRAANQRERRRMVTLNDAFDMLKQRIPTFTHEKKLSRIETLRLAISYIGFMGQLVDGKHPSDVTAGLPFIKSDDDQSGHGGLADVIDNYSYVMHESAMAPADSMATMDAAAYVTDMSQYHHNGYYSNGGFMTQ